MPVNKIAWQKIEGLTEPGRYHFNFGWLTVTADDFFVGEKFPKAAFTLVKVSSPSETEEDFRLGAFDTGEEI